MATRHDQFLMFVAKNSVINGKNHNRRKPRCSQSSTNPGSRGQIVSTNSTSKLNRNTNGFADFFKSDKGAERLKEEMLLACREQEKLKIKSANLKQSLQCVRQQTFTECVKILNSVLMYCDIKANGGKMPPIPDICASRPLPKEEKVGAGMGGPGCGGYTPGGANRLKGLRTRNRTCADPNCANCGDEEAFNFVKEKREKAGLAATEEAKDCSAFDDLPADSRPSVRIVGEMCFQLERRILDYVFGVVGNSKSRRFYGYTVSNICYMMEKESTKPDGGSDVIGRTEMTCRLRKMLSALEKYGYDVKVHADFAQQIVNKYGLLPSQPDETTTQLFGLNDPGSMSCMISRLCKRQSEVHNLNIVLNCLAFLSKCDGRPLFIW